MTHLVFLTPPPYNTHTGKCGNTIHKLSCTQERAYKKHRLEHPECRREEWLRLTDREKRCLHRGWTRRERNVRKKFHARRRYLATRVGELEMREKETKALIDRLRVAKMGDVSVLLKDAINEEGVADAGLGGSAAPSTHSVIAPISDAQRVRLYSQAEATKKVLKGELHRDLSQLAEYKIALRLLDAEGADGPAKLAATDDEVYEHMNEASIIRFNHSFLLIAARVIQSAHLNYKPTTILRWAHEFRALDGHFKCDGRGMHEREWVLCEEDLQLQLLEWLKGQKRVSTKKTHEYVNGVLLANEGGLLRLAKYGLTLPISSTTVHSWMVKLGCKYERAVQSYYTDGHEREDVVQYRGVYCREKRRHALRQPCWARTEWGSLRRQQKAEIVNLTEEGDEAFWAEAFRWVDESDGKEYVEFHVDWLSGGPNDKNPNKTHDSLRVDLGEEGGSYSVRFHQAAAVPCRFSHEPDVCKCSKQLYHIGQDESIYRPYAREGNEWVIQGVRGLRKKTEGQGEMVSAFQCETRGFGFPLTEAELVKINEFRERHGRPALRTSPGLRFMQHGKNREGFWGYAEFEEQVVDVMDCFDVIYPDKQLMIEVDHSAGHTKFREDGLHVGSMNTKYGGKQKILRDTVMTEGCLGPGEAKMYLNGGQWSTQFIEGATERTVDLKLQLGDTQCMAFAADAPPPFYSWGAPATDVMGTKGRDKRAKRSAVEGIVGSADGGGFAVVQEGYVGKQKGMKQVLWERGLYVDGMSAAEKAPPEKRIDLILANLPDFKNEKSALQHTIESRGHILLLSPKFHPEIAGVGIEYSWGMSKLKFRREINDEVAKHLHANMEASMCRATILTLGRVRRFARRTRDYCRAYYALENDGPIESKEKVETMRQIYRGHRNIIDMEPRFIDLQ